MKKSKILKICQPKKFIIDWNCFVLKGVTQLWQHQLVGWAAVA